MVAAVDIFRRIKKNGLDEPIIIRYVGYKCPNCGVIFTKLDEYYVHALEERDRIGLDDMLRRVEADIKLEMAQ